MMFYLIPTFTLTFVTFALCCFYIFLANGNCYSWGFGTYGQLGHGEEKTFLSLPKRLPHEQLSRNVARVSCGENYSTAITGRLRRIH